VLDDKPARRHPLQALGHHLAQLAHTPATARASGGGRIDHARARQVLGKWTPGRLATGKPTHFGRLAGIRDLGRVRLSRGLLQVLQRELDLPPSSGGDRSEYQAAFRMVIASMLARASTGVR
jgi:hypothetical protein